MAVVFKLEITLRGQAMVDSCDVARSLRKLADKLNSYDAPEEGVVADANGNTVGRWAFEEGKAAEAILSPELLYWRDRK